MINQVLTKKEIAEAKSIVEPSVTNRLFPIFLKLEEMKVLVIGGGAVALEKLTALLGNSPDAEISLVAPEIKDEIISLALLYPNLHLFKREYSREDLNDKEILIAATNRKELNSHIRNQAKEKNILVNVADTPELCDFYLSSIVQKGSIKLAISTNGKSPTIAKRLKEVLNKAIPDEMEDVLDNLVQIRNRLNGNFSEKVKELNRITSVLVEEQAEKNHSNTVTIITASAIVLLVAVYITYPYLSTGALGDFLSNAYSSTDPNLHWFVLAGFIAQMIDGALGMAYGVSATTFLLSLGIPPAAASASVHASEVFTSGASGFMHWKFGNVSRNLFKRLVLPGVLGAILGAFFLSSLENYNYIVKPVIAFYTLILGTIILIKALGRKKEKKELKYITPLAGAGGFLDSVGGGGWGPIVSSTLIAKGKHPVVTIGSVNLAEFFVALASSAAFMTFIGITHWQIIIGLILGGIIAAPVAAKTAGKLPVKAMMISVGGLIILVSLRIIINVIL